MSELFNRFKQIKTFIFDVDGVLTDGSINALDSGECFRTFHIHDAYAIQHAIRAGFRVAIISAANTEGVRKWLTVLTVKDLFMGGPNDQKINAYLGYLTRDSLNENEVLYMGDDIPDHEILRRPTLVSTCPADAADEVQAICDYVSPKAGGRGAVRDVIEHVMKAQGLWFNK